MPACVKAQSPPRWADACAVRSAQRPLGAVRCIGPNPDDTRGAEDLNDLAKVLVACLKHGCHNGRREFVRRHVGASFIEQKQGTVVDEEDLLHGGLQ